MMYLIHFVLFSGILWILFRLLLRRETFLRYNRLFLLAIPLLAGIIPVLKFDFLNFSNNTVAMVGLPEIDLFANETAESADSGAAMGYQNWLWLIYGVGVLFSLILFIKRIVALHHLKSIGKTTCIKGIDIISLPESREAFSFLNSVFIGDQFVGKQYDQILEHEMEHVRQSHGYDLIYFEIIRIICWFNPFIHLIQKELSEVHEFSVDKKIIQHQSKRKYIENLLSVSLDVTQFSFTNSFFTNKSLKTRVAMLYKQSSSKTSFLKYSIIIFSLLLMMVYVSCGTSKTEERNQAQSAEIEKISKSEALSKQESIPFQKVDRSPEFTDSPSFNSEEERKKYFSNRIQSTFNEKFDIEKAKEYAEEGQIVRIASQFEINEEGNILDIKVKSPAPEMDKLVKEVLLDFAKFKPAKVDGKPVKVVFNLPIVFQNNKKKDDKKED